MKLFWFSDAEGHSWFVFAAADEDTAWKLFQAKCGGQHIDIRTFELDSVCHLTQPGMVAYIEPLSCNFGVGRVPQPPEIDGRPMTDAELMAVKVEARNQRGEAGHSDDDD